MTSSTGSIGGVPALPNIDSSTSLKKLATAEDQLLRAQLQVEQLQAQTTDPKILAKLQESLNSILANFSKILEIKYQLSAPEAVDRWLTAQAQIDALVDQIATITEQINFYVQDNVVQNTNLVAANQTFQTAKSQYEANTVAINNLLPSVDQTFSRVLNGLKNALQFGGIPPGDDNIVIYNRIVQNINNLSTTLHNDIGPLGIPAINLQRNLQTIINDVNTLFVNGGSVVDGTLDRLLQTLSSFQTGTTWTTLIEKWGSAVHLQLAYLNADSNVSSIKAKISSNNQNISNLNQQLLTAQNDLLAAQIQLEASTAFFKTLTITEQNLFKELYPELDIII